MKNISLVFHHNIHLVDNFKSELIKQVKSIVNLESINIPSSVKEIGFFVFSGCRSLKTVTIPASVDYVGGDLFKGCSNLTLNCEADSKPAEWESNWSSGIEVNWGYTAE